MLIFKKIKKYLFITFGTVFGLLVLGLILSFVFEDDIKKFALQKINENVTTEIKVAEVDFSVIKKFPSASLQFKNVLIYETFDTKDTLIYAKNIYLEFNILDLVKGKYDVKTVSLEKAITHFKWNENKEDNFHFWKENTTDSETNFSFSIEELILKDAKLIIDYQPTKFYLSSSVSKIKAFGSFDKSNTSFTSDFDLVLNSLKNGKEVYSDNYHLDGKLQTTLNESGLITFTDGKVDIDDLLLNISGTVDNKKTSTDFNLKISSDKVDIDPLLAHLPQSFQNKLTNYKSNGTTKLSCLIKGKNDENNRPDISIDFEINDASFKHLSSNTKLDNIQSFGKFVMLNKEKEKLTITKFDASFEGNSFRLNGFLADFSKPNFDFTTKGHLSLEDIKNFADLQSLDELSGIIDLNTRFSGSLKSFNNIEVRDLKNINIKGVATVKEAQVQLKGSEKHFENIEARLIFDSQDTKIDFLNGTVEDSDFSLKGSLFNVLPYLFYENQNLIINAAFNSQNLNFNNLISSSENTTEGEYNLVLPENIEFTVSANVSYFTFRNFVANDLTGTAKLKNKVFSIDPISFKSSEGSISGNLNAKADKKNNIKLQCVLDINGVNVNQLFYEFENFGQDIIGQKNIKGKASAHIQFSSELNSSLAFNSDKISSSIDITINDGELLDLTAMTAISDYISSNRMLSRLVNEDKLDRKLKHIEFSKLSNTIIIENGEIRIPNMDIYSSAMDITVSGTHNFNNNIDYTLGFKIRDVLSADNKTEFGEELDDGEGNYFFLSMAGNTSNPSFSYDNIAHREKRKEDRLKGKENFKDLVKKEFSKKKNDQNQSNFSSNTAEISIEGHDSEPIKKKKKKWFERTDEKEEESTRKDSDDDDDDF